MKKKSKTLTKSIMTFMMTAAMVLGTMSLPSEASTPKEFRWLGKDGVARVNTGLGNGNETEGLWWVANDSADGGKSELILSGNTDPFLPGNYISDEDVKKSGGISGTAKLKKGALTYNPMIYVGFNVVGVDSESHALVEDATDWGGLSIAYECDIDASLELGFGDTVDSQIGYANHCVNLPKTNPGECKVLSFAWSKFVQPGWGKTIIPIEDAIKGLASIKFKIQGNDGSEVHFKIIGIGSKDADLSSNCSVTFETNGGSAVATQSVEPGQKVTKPADPTKSGFTFAGWYTDSALTTPFDFNEPITKNTTIYAKWIDATDSVTYTVAFNTNGGSPVSSQSVKSGEKAVKPADPVKEGYIFDGWYKDSECKTVFDFNTPITEPIMLYAKWIDASAIKTHTVTFNTNGGSKVASQTVVHGKKAALPDDPTKEGYKFEGWFSDSALTKPFEFNDPITDDVMIYAKWSENNAAPAPADTGTKLVDEEGEANYVVLSAGKTDASDASKNEMPTVEYSGTTNNMAKKVTVPDTFTYNGVVYNVESISADALKNNKKLTSVTIGKNVKEIKKNAFAGCTSLKTVNCKSKVLAKIGANAFKGDKKLTKITLKTTLLKKSKVGSNAIKGTSKKLKISAPKKVRKSYQKIFKAKGNKKVKVK
ncbi:MAG: InlB B-repeat-containing protein [Eubacterium sp.]|nr:InlB B-repeat-containing protein [Eubacterium sp.]